MKKSTLSKSIVAVLLCSMLAACSSGVNQNEGKEGSSPDNKAAPEKTVDPSGKYDPPIELTTIRTISSEQYFDEGENIDKNAIYDHYEEKYGIKVKNKWTVANEYGAKLKIAIASNDLPDFYKVPVSDLQQLIDNDMIMDLTELWEQNASETTKKEFTKDGGRQLNTATLGNKLMAIPVTNSPFNSMGFLWLRKDWLNEMNLPEPKTIEDMVNISKAFASRDSGGKGKSYGLMLSKELSLATYFSGYSLYPFQWVKDDAGNLVYGGVDSENKVALQQLQDMFKAGQIDPEFGVKDANRALELAVNGQVGLFYGDFWHSAVLHAGAIKDGKQVQDWAAYLLPSLDGQPALSPTTAAVPEFYVVNKNAKHPEAVFKLLNEWIESQVNPNQDNKVLVFGKDRVNKDQFFYDINPIVVFSQDHVVMSGDLIPRALRDNDPSILGEDIDRLARYESAKQFKEGVITGANWLQHMIAGENGTMSMMYDAYKKDLFHYDEFYGAPTPTIGEKWSILQAKQIEVMTKIIMGSVNVDEYDKFVAEWKRLGGDQITTEVNEWYQTISKSIS